MPLPCLYDANHHSVFDLAIHVLSLNYVVRTQGGGQFARRALSGYA